MQAATAWLNGDFKEERDQDRGRDDVYGKGFRPKVVERVGVGWDVGEVEEEGEGGAVLGVVGDWWDRGGGGSGVGRRGGGGG